MTSKTTSSVPSAEPHSRESSVRSAALIELGAGHVDAIYPQLLFLRRGGYRVHLVCAEHLRDQVCEFEPVDHFVYLHPGNDFAGHWKCVFAVRRYLRAHRISTVIFNTGGGNHTRDICAVAPMGTKLAGIVHHTHKLKASFTQSLISLRMKKGFVLNDYLLDSVPPHRRSQFESIYLIYREPVKEQEVSKKPDELWIGVPGEVDFRRRDYEGLIREIRERGPLHRSVRFILIGECSRENRDGRALRELIASSGLEQHFILFDRFVEGETFFAYLRKCDALLTLIHPVTQFYSFYKEHQISGTYSLAFGSAKPLLVHEALRGPEDFELSAFFYNAGNLVSLLDRLAADRNACSSMSDRIRSCAKYSFEYQAEKYLRFLER